MRPGHRGGRAADDQADLLPSLRILREAGIITKRIQGARGYMSLRKDDLDRRFPGLMDSIVAADSETVA